MNFIMSITESDQLLLLHSASFSQCLRENLRLSVLERNPKMIHDRGRDCSRRHGEKPSIDFRKCKSFVNEW